MANATYNLERSDPQLFIIRYSLFICKALPCSIIPPATLWHPPSVRKGALGRSLRSRFKCRQIHPSLAHTFSKKCSLRATFATAREGYFLGNNYMWLVPRMIPPMQGFALRYVTRLVGCVLLFRLLHPTRTTNH